MMRHAVRLLVLVTVILLITGQVARAEAAAAPRVYILLIDGLDGRRLGEHLTPTLWALAHSGKERATFYADARAVMPAVTNANHAAVITAAYAAAHGIIGNALWDRRPGHPPSGSEYARHLEVETLFTVIERDRPALTTAGIFGKSRLVNLFAEVPKRQKRPDILWGDVAAESEPSDARAGFASDQRTMDEVLRTITLRDPDFLFAALPDVDRTAHVFGPDAHAARKALLEADRQLKRLVDFLHDRGSWEHTVLMVTADHGFASVEPEPSPDRAYPLILFGRELARAGISGVAVLSLGRLEAIALPGPAPRSLTGADAERLARIRALALAQPEIAEAWYRLPNPADGGEAFTLGRAHPEWRIDHPRAGELVLVAQPNHHFGDPFTLRIAAIAGNHGGPDESHVPIVITGGDPRLRAQVIAAGGPVPQAVNPDLGATAAWLLGVRMPRTTGGTPVPADLAGRVLREAFQ